MERLPSAVARPVPITAWPSDELAALPDALAVAGPTTSRSWATGGLASCDTLEMPALLPELLPKALGMAIKQLRFGKGFRVALSNQRAQAATMVIAPGKSEGGPDNRHQGADQWLFVLSGTGVAIFAATKHRLKANSLLLIECGTIHEIRNTGRTPLKTLNVYVPPAYRADGEELPRGRKG